MTEFQRLSSLIVKGNLLLSKSNFLGLDIMSDEARQNLQMVKVKSNW